jgi:hypothetical protein
MSVTLCLDRFAILRASTWGAAQCLRITLSLEDMIAIESVAQQLWEQATKGSSAEWQSLSVLAKQAWRNRAQIAVTFWRRSVGAP